MIICGVDPGLSGALALIDGQSCQTYDMPTLCLSRGGKNKREIDPHALANLLWKSHAGHAFVEQGWSRPENGGAAAFAAGKAHGIIIGCLAAVGVPYTFVAPQRWKKALAVSDGKAGARSRASQLLPCAAEQWPLVKHDGRAESALIALYGIRELAGIARGEAA